MEIISKPARNEIIGALRTRYQQASKDEKGMILGEFTAVTGFHRKHAIRLLNAAAEAIVKKSIENSMSSQRIYGRCLNFNCFHGFRPLGMAIFSSFLSPP